MHMLRSHEVVPYYVDTTLASRLCVTPAFATNLTCITTHRYQSDRLMLSCCLACTGLTHILSAAQEHDKHPMTEESAACSPY